MGICRAVSLPAANSYLTSIWIVGLEAQKTEAENLQIVQLVRSMRLSPHELSAMPVSYTHLDVYKRQRLFRCELSKTRISSHACRH